MHTPNDLVTALAGLNRQINDFYHAPFNGEGDEADTMVWDMMVAKLRTVFPENELEIMEILVQGYGEVVALTKQRKPERAHVKALQMDTLMETLSPDGKYFVDSYRVPARAYVHFSNKQYTAAATLMNRTIEICQSLVQRGFRILFTVKNLLMVRHLAEIAFEEAEDKRAEKLLKDVALFLQSGDIGDLPLIIENKVDLDSLPYLKGKFVLDYLAGIIQLHFKYLINGRCGDDYFFHTVLASVDDIAIHPAFNEPVNKWLRAVKLFYGTDRPLFIAACVDFLCAPLNFTFDPHRVFLVHLLSRMLRDTGHFHSGECLQKLHAYTVQNRVGRERIGSFIFRGAGAQ